MSIYHTADARCSFRAIFKSGLNTFQQKQIGRRRFNYGILKRVLFNDKLWMAITFSWSFIFLYEYYIRINKDNVLALNRRQAITSTSVYKDVWRH